jgi:hypothetical protein
MSLDDFCARPHALVSFAGDLSGFLDEELEKLGRKRHVVLAVPQFNGLGTLLAGTDIVATVPDYAAEALTSAGGLRAEALARWQQQFKQEQKKLAEHRAPGRDSRPKADRQR